MRAFMRGVDRPEEIDHILGLSTYASIPYSQGQRRIVRKVNRKDSNKDNLILTSLVPDDSAVEAIRSLRTSLHFAMMEAKNNIVMITGPIAGLGKSFVSINLGAVLAVAGKRTIVIDADMRRGLLHRYVGVTQHPGMSDCVSNSADLSSVINKTAVEKLDFISCGMRPPNPSEVLMSERFVDLLNKLSAEYDYVIIDTPPVLPVADPAIIGRIAGSTFIVLKAAEHPMRVIDETLRRLRQAGVDVRGAIFNQVGARIGSYGYGTYGYAYGYSNYKYTPK
jgi:tyrosine-protein kinase Etk/Wzc